MTLQLGLKLYLVGQSLHKFYLFIFHQYSSICKSTMATVQSILYSYWERAFIWSDNFIDIMWASEEYLLLRKIYYLYLPSVMMKLKVYIWWNSSFKAWFYIISKYFQTFIWNLFWIFENGSISNHFNYIWFHNLLKIFILNPEAWLKERAIFQY